MAIRAPDGANKPLSKDSCIQFIIEIPPQHAKKRTIPTSNKSQNLNTTKEHSLSKIIHLQAGPQIPPTQKHKQEKPTHKHRKRNKKENIQKQTREKETTNQISRVTCPRPSASTLACRFHHHKNTRKTKTRKTSKHIHIEERKNTKKLTNKQKESTEYQEPPVQDHL